MVLTLAQYRQRLPTDPFLKAAQSFLATATLASFAKQSTEIALKAGSVAAIVSLICTLVRPLFQHIFQIRAGWQQQAERVFSKIVSIQFSSAFIRLAAPSLIAFYESTIVIGTLISIYFDIDVFYEENLALIHVI